MDLDKSLVKLTAELEREMAISQNLDFRQAVREGGHVTINQTQNVSITSPEFLTYVLKMARETVLQEMQEARLAHPAFNLAEVERRTMIAALKASGWDQSKAAPLLGLTRRAMHYKVTLLGLTHPRWRRNKGPLLTEGSQA